MSNPKPSLSGKIPDIQSSLNLLDPQYFLNRELSWLEFNRRVLYEAIDPRTPLLERLKFMAIFSSNLDEYFMVRVSGLREQVDAGVAQLSPDGFTPEEQLAAISQRLHPLVKQQHQHFEDVLRPLMATHGIHLRNFTDLSQKQRDYLQQYFEERIFPVLTPLAVDPGHPFPHISNLSLNLAVVVKDPVRDEERFARIKVPNILPRFIVFPKDLHPQNDCNSGAWTGIPLEQAIAHNLEFLFPGMTVQECHLFRITRDGDFEFQEEEADDLLLAIEQEISKRRLGGSVVRLEIQSSMPSGVKNTLMDEMDMTEKDVYSLDGLLNLRDLMSFISLPLPELKDPPWTPVIPNRLKWVSDFDPEKNIPRLEEGEDIFAIIRHRDLMVHHPYESFAASVQQFITQSAYDPSVLAIKMTLYRTSGDSPIVKALIAAAENGKQVVALVELKARFDEENNINWARKLENAGVHVVYGLVGLKTHTKIVLVVRQEGGGGPHSLEGRIRRYVHIGTGNYNPKTARLYTDLGLLSCREDLGADLTDLFNYLTGYSRQHTYRKLLVAPVNLREQMIIYIRQEIHHSQTGASGQIIAKMNSLVDPTLISILYEASQAGVQIDLIVRGICCLRPGLPGISENIRVISLVGRFLEHSRIFYFHNNGQEQLLIGSADWMPRNLDRRVEAVVPVEEPGIVKDLQEILRTLLADNYQTWELQSDGSYIPRRAAANESLNIAQQRFMELASSPG
ncbi:MAG: polyphosphate kinase 1 [Synechococcales bacterium]|nr:polyphosphate kinase 1 [Cyanobacteria bacterium REEB444]MEB3124441.1 polyphosphate kinase 1 [Synechococcales bacterium]